MALVLFFGETKLILLLHQTLDLVHRLLVLQVQLCLTEDSVLMSCVCLLDRAP
jgi:hypothetical protein